MPRLTPLLGARRIWLPPGTPIAWWDPDNINLKRNFGVADASTPLTIKNLTSGGSAYDFTQATTGTRLVFRKIASAGLMGNHSGLEGNGSQGMATNLFTLIAQPITFVTVVKWVNNAATVVLFSGSATNRTQLYWGSGGVVSSYNGAGATPGVPAMTSGKYQTIGQLANGASSTAYLDGTTSAAYSSGTAGHDKFTIMCADAPPTNGLQGMWMGSVAYGAGAPSMATIAAAYATKFGATPQ